MKSCRARRLLLAALLAASTPGCALLMESPSHVGGRATLGDAATAANPDSSKKQRPLDVGYTLPPDDQPEAGVAVESFHSGDGNGSSRRDRAATGTSAVLGVVAGGGTIGGTRYDGFGEFGLSLGWFVTPNLRLDVLGAVSPIQFADETLAGQSFRDEFDLGLDVTARYYLTAAHTFVGVYPIAGMRFGTLFWDFAQPVIVREDGQSRTVKTDWINHFSLYGGLGMSLVQVRHVHVGTSLLGGVRIYSPESSNGFENTLFPDAGFVQMRVEAGYRF